MQEVIDKVLERKEELGKIWKHHGEKSQLDKLKEELEELIYDVEDFLTAKTKAEADEAMQHMIGNIADVQVMISQTVANMHLGKAVSKVMEFKIQRTITKGHII